MSRKNDTVYRNRFSREYAEKIADLYLFGGQDIFVVVFQNSGSLRREMYELFDAGAGLCDCQIFQEGAQLHDKRDLSGSKIFSDADGGYQSERDQDVSLDIKGGDKPDYSF